MSDPGDNIFLVGPMGSGKTTVGRKAALRLGLDFVDCDEEIEARTGASVNLIFDVEGEEGFRKRETELILELAEGKGRLVATGGGAVLRPENRQAMNSGGRVVWLRTPVDQQVKRLEMDKKRPLLHRPDWIDRLGELAAERDPLYAEVADLVFDSRSRSVQATATQLVRAILETWGKTEAGNAHALH